MTLYLYKFNNYYNRIVVRKENLSDYGNPIVTLTETNFVPGNGINTSHIFNTSEVITTADYCLAVNENGEIVSRWFIMNYERLRAGQYKIELLRDVMAEFLPDVLNSTAYIEKATLPSTNPLIYNSEGMQFNKIKKKEDLLYDKTKRPWIVGYVAGNVTKLNNVAIVFQGDNAPLTNYSELVNYSQHPIKVITNPYIDSDVSTKNYYWHAAIGPNAKYYTYTYHLVPDNTVVVTKKQDEVSGLGRDSIMQTVLDSGPVVDSLTTVMRGKGPSLAGMIADYYSGYETSNIYQQYNGKIVHNVDNDKYYKVTVINKGSTNYKKLVRGIDSATNNLWNNIYNLMAQSSYITFLQTGRYNQYIGFNATEYQLSLTEIQYGDISITFSGNQRMLQDAPYYMFAIPYTEKNLLLATQIGIKNQENILDIQILPYCPVQDYYSATGAPILTGLTQGKDYEYITEETLPTEQYTDILFWCTKSIFTFDIPYKIAVTDIKVQNECDMYRLCSPNGNGQFEFNAAKNGGVLSINIDCTYRPIDPYIHLNPNFGNLYGQDFNDFRGLILNGDFSIPAINDSWISYTINNKNYQNIFNREIQSMELANKWAGTQDIFNAIIGTLSGGVGGAGAGWLFGGGLGMGIGAGVSAIGSGVAGYFDVKANKELRQDQINLKKDLFNYNIQNIQAIPQSVSKTGCITNNNKLVPYVEYYTCTDVEKQVLRDKIKYTGMTVGCVGKVGDYVTTGAGMNNPTYIQANIIEIDLDEDYAITMEIANTLKGGIRVA